MSTHQDPDPQESLEFVGPDDSRWYRTQIPDWIALHPKVTHTAYRLLVIVRSLILEKQPDKVRLLSYEHLAFLLPGKSGKPTSVDVIKDALRVLHDVGLMSNPDGERIVRSTGRGGIQTRRRFRLHDWPTEGESYPGWRNAFDKLDAFTEDWRTTRTDVSAGQIDGGKNPQRTDQGERGTSSTETPNAHPSSPAKTNVSAGRFVGGKKLSDGGKKLSDGGKKPGDADVTSENADSLKELPEGVPQTSPPSPPRGADVGPDPAGREDDTDHSGKNNATGVTAASDVTTDTPPDSVVTADSGDALGRAQVIVDDAVRRWPRHHRAPGLRDRQRLSERVSVELAAGGEESTILDELTRDLVDVGSAVRVVLGSRTKTPGWGRSCDPRPDHRRHEPAGPRPVWCGLCDERTRHVAALAPDGSERMRRCQQCHPDSVEKRTLDAATETEPEVGADAGPEAGPVELDDTVLEVMKTSLDSAAETTSSRATLAALQQRAG